jgi:hypothetical protein
MSDFKAEASLISITFENVSGGASTAETLEAKFQAALKQLDDVAAEIERDGPEYVVHRGRNVGCAEALDSIEQAFRLLGYAETYLHQHAKNELRRLG